MNTNPAADTLRGRQLAFAAAVTDHGGPSGGHSGSNDHSSPGGANLLAPAADGQPARLDVYRHAYTARLTAALRDNHEVLARAMGDEAFNALARAYASAQPSTQPSIRWFGHRLAAFMAADAAGSATWVAHPALVDLARMDWALRSAFDAADGPVLQAADVSAIPARAWPALRLRLHPSVQCERLDWAVEAAWQRLRLALDADDAQEPELPAPEALPHTLLVWRRGLRTQWRSLTEDEAALLASLAAGEPFAALCACAAQQCGDADAALARVVQAVQQWLGEGLLASAEGPAHR